MSFLYWLYLWQLKEYRWDRVRVELRSWPSTTLLKRWLFGQYRRPKVTVKLALITGFSALFLLVVYALFVLYAGAWGEAVGLGVVWLLTPAAVSASVAILAIPSILVTRVLAGLAARKRQQFPDLTVIGVTGSYGKTTTKEFIAQLLSQKFRVLKTPSSVNTKIGIARQILKELAPGTQVYVVEMGAYQRGEIKQICQMVKPKIGVLTGLNEQHLALFGSFENLRAAKLELARSLPEHGVLFYNADDKRVVEATKILKFTKLHQVSYASANRGDFEFPRKLEDLEFLGVNLAAAIKVAQSLGLNRQQIQRGIANLEPPPRTMQISQSASGATIIDDTYSTNPDGFLAALNVLGRYSDKTKVVVTPGLIELGESSEEVHQRISTKLVDVVDLVIITNPSLQGFFPSARLVQTPTGAVEAIREFCEGSVRDLVILLEGRLTADIINKISKPYDKFGDDRRKNVIAR